MLRPLIDEPPPAPPPIVVTVDGVALDPTGGKIVSAAWKAALGAAMGFRAARQFRVSHPPASVAARRALMQAERLARQISRTWYMREELPTEEDEQDFRRAFEEAFRAALMAEPGTLIRVRARMRGDNGAGQELIVVEEIPA